MATDIIARMANPSFDSSHEIIADIDNDVNGLVPARSARLSFLGSSLRLQAESDGRSILLVPLEFSHCLEASSVKNMKPILFRANLLETGVLFSGTLDTTLSIRTGPFLDPACRLWDTFDARTVKVEDVPPAMLPVQSSGG